jgi:hypothetical protein
LIWACQYPRALFSSLRLLSDAFADGQQVVSAYLTDADKARQWEIVVLCRLSMPCKSRISVRHRNQTPNGEGAEMVKQVSRFRVCAHSAPGWTTPTYGARLSGTRGSPR